MSHWPDFALQRAAVVRPSPSAQPARRPRAACALLALLTGCASVAPPTSLPPVVTPSAWQQPADGSTSAAVVPTQWWRALADPQLDRLVEQAVAGAPDLRSAQARLREARARRAAAGASLAPSLSGAASASRLLVTAANGERVTSSLFDIGFDARWEADLFGGLQAGVDAADADLGAIQASLADTLVTLQAEVARSVVELRSLQARQALAADNLALQAETLQLTRWRAQAGLVSVLDVEQALANHEQTRAQLFALQGSQAQARQALELLVGVVPGALSAELSPPRSLPALPAVALTLPADMLRQRADVRGAGQQWLAEVARTEQARANLYPKLTLSGSISWRAPLLNALGDGLAGSLLAGLVTPIFDAGRLRAQLDAQTAVQERLAIAYEGTVLAALSDVEGALAALAASRGRAEALAVAATSSAEAATLARTRYQSGLIDFRTVLDTERSLLAAQDSLASARADGLAAWVRLHKALGGGDTAAATPPIAPSASPAS